MTTIELNRLIDHTLLKPEATRTSIERLCQEARDWKFWSVCVNPCWVSLCSELLKQTESRVCTVIGFPLGANLSSTKAFEAEWALNNGAQEIDMVINIGFVKSGTWKAVNEDIAAVVKAAQGHVVKVILETSLLSEEEKIKACHASLSSGAHFVKTSTGFNGGGATLEDIQLMKREVKDQMKIKASGGIRDLMTMQSMISAGADRIGTSSATQFLAGLKAQGEY